MPSLQFPQRLANRQRRTDERVCASHRAWVRRHYCSVPGCQRTPIECAHVRSAGDGGMGMKPSDKWAISLCDLHHREQHRIGEREFERRHAIDLVAIAREFARRSPHWLKLSMM
jgi:hypothetical protein